MVGTTPGPLGCWARTRAAIVSGAGAAGRSPSGGSSSCGRSGSKPRRGEPSARTFSRSASTSARNPSNPSFRMRNFMRFACRWTRSPSRWKTRTTASDSSSSSPAGRNGTSTCADTGKVAVPPPARTRKPRPPSGPRRARKPRSWIAAAAWSSGQPSKATLNFRGSELESGWRRKWRVNASAYGLGSNTSSAATPARGQAVTLRIEFPHASRVVMPASAIRRIAASAPRGVTKWIWTFWRVVTWTKPRPCASATSASASSWAPDRTPCGILMRCMWTSACRCPYVPWSSRKWRHASAPISPRSNLPSMARNSSRSRGSENGARSREVAAGTGAGMASVLTDAPPPAPPMPPQGP